MPWLGENSLDTWFPWLINDDGIVKPLDSQYDLELYKLD